MTAAGATCPGTHRLAERIYRLTSKARTELAREEARAAGRALLVDILGRGVMSPRAHQMIAERLTEMAIQEAT